MIDPDLRDLERRALASPDDDAAAEHAVEAFTRAGREVPFSLLTRRRRWRRLAEFVTRWLGSPLAEIDGAWPDQINRAVRRLGGQIPEVMQEWLLLVGRRRSVSGFIDTRTRPHGTTGLWPVRVEELRIGNGLEKGDQIEVVRIYSERDGAFAFGLRALDLGMPDPPVLVADDGRNWRGLGQRLSVFYTCAALVVWALGAPAERGAPRPTSPDRIRDPLRLAALRDHYPPLPIDPPVWHRVCGDAAIEFRGDDETLVVIWLDHGAYAAVRTEDALPSLLAVIAGP